MIWLCCAAFAGDLVIRADEIRTVSGPPISDGVIVIEGDRIVGIGPADSVRIPEGVEVIEGAVATPGLIDAMATVGLTGALNRPSDQDHREDRHPVQPELRALDGFDPHESLVGWVRDHGVTTIQVGPSPGPIVAGRTLITTTDAEVLDPDAWVVFSLGEPPKHLGDGSSSRMGTAAQIRQALTDARGYTTRRRLSLSDRPQTDLGLEALGDLLAGRRRAVFHAHRADDLLTALRISEEFGLDPVLAGGAEAYLIRETLAEAQVPVLVGPVMIRGWRHGERANANFANAALLADAGVPIGLMTGYEGYVPKVRVVLWEAAIAAANGLGPDRALAALTSGNAALLGIGDDVGTLEVGKRADVAVFDGDPFEYTTHVCAVVVGGDVASRTCR